MATLKFKLSIYIVFLTTFYRIYIKMLIPMSNPNEVNT